MLSISSTRMSREKKCCEVKLKGLLVLYEIIRPRSYCNWHTSTIIILRYWLLLFFRVKEDLRVLQAEWFTNWPSGSSYCRLLHKCRMVGKRTGVHRATDVRLLHSCAHSSGKCQRWTFMSRPQNCIYAFRGAFKSKHESKQALKSTVMMVHVEHFT